MTGFESIGKMLLIFGGILVFLGLLFLGSGRIPHVGRLLGDVLFQRGNFSFYFPLMTSILLSIALTIILNVVLRLFR